MDPLHRETRSTYGVDLGWKHRQVEFAFHLGLPIWSRVRLPGIVQTAHFFALHPWMSEEAPKRLLAERDVEVAFIPSCPFDDELPTLSLLPDALRYIPYRYPHYFTRLDGTWEDFLREQMNRKQRKHLRRMLRLFAEKSGGVIAYRSFSTPEEIKAFYAEASVLSEKTYQARWLRCGLPSTRAFVEDMERRSEEGSCLGFLLYCEGQPICYLYATIEECNTLVLSYTGYDPAFERDSPGLVLFAKVFEQLHVEKRLEWVDLTQGEGLHKRRFATDHQDSGDVYFFCKTPKNLCWVISHLCFQYGYQQTRFLLREWGLETKIREWLRT